MNIMAQPANSQVSLETANPEKPDAARGTRFKIPKVSRQPAKQQTFDPFASQKSKVNKWPKKPGVDKQSTANKPEPIMIADSADADEAQSTQDLAARPTKELAPHTGKRS